MDEIIMPPEQGNTDKTDEREDTPAAEPQTDTDTDTDEAEDEPEPEQDEPEAEPPKPTKPSAPTDEEEMLRYFLERKHPDTLRRALAEGKTIRGAWNYVVSVMKNAYIAAHGRVSGGMCGSPSVVTAIAERYLREFPEGAIEPEAKHEVKKPTAPAKPTAKSAKPDPKKVVEKTAKAAAKTAKKVNEQAEKVKALFGSTQLSFNFG